MLLRLIPQNTALPPREFGSEALPLILGRSPIAGCYLPDRWVSRHHCQLSLEDGRLVARDLDSKHGTLVNDRPIFRQSLRSGDRLTMGLTTLLVEVVGAASQDDDSCQPGARASLDDSAGSTQAGALLAPGSKTTV